VLRLNKKLLAPLLLLAAATPVFAADLGTNLWTLATGRNSDTSPAMDGHGVLYVSTWLGDLWAVNTNGSVKWVFHGGREMKSSPAIAADGTIYVGSRDRKLYAVTAAGKKKWEFKTGAWVDSSPGIADDGTVYFGSWDKKFYALNADGAKKWEFATGGEIVSSPAIGADGAIYFGSHDRKFYALNPDGTKRWDFATGGPILSSPAIGAQGVLYITSVDGKLYALNPDGTKRWEQRTGGVSESSPTVGLDGTVFVGVNSNYCAVTRDGQKLWSHTLWQYFPADYVDSSGTIAADGTSYFTGGDNRFWAVGPDGKWKWSLWLDAGSVSSPVIGPDGTIYVLSRTGQLRAVKGAVPLANSPWPMFRADPRHTGRAPASP
jgi:outer membrane protein assembly factor BamB